MKRTSLFLALTALMVFSFGLVHGANDVTLDHMDGLYNVGDSVQCGQPICWHFRLDNSTGAAITGATNGFRVWMVHDGARTPATLDTHNLGWGDIFDLVRKIYTAANGTGSDTVGFGGARMSSTAGIPIGFNEEVYHVCTQANASADGDTLCIDSAFYPPGGEWIWAVYGMGTMYPGWDGPHCFHVYNVPDLNWIFDNCPTATLEKDHCEVAQVVLTAHDQDTEDPEPTATFTLISGPGNVVTGPANTATWSYAPSITDVCITYTIVIEVDDGMGGPVDICEFYVHFTNEGPYCEFTPDTAFVIRGNPITVTGTGYKVDCDPVTWYFVSVTPTTVNYSFTQVGDDGKLTFTPSAPEEGIYCFTLGVTDGVDSSECTKCIEVGTWEGWDVAIENKTNAMLGQYEDVCVTVENLTGASGLLLGGFDFLIAYDASALNFRMAYGGDLYEYCGWEYFTYRYGPFGNCGNQCPSGLLRVVGISETNNGPYHPSCFILDMPFTLFCMSFLVTSDYTLECQVLPIRFFWMDCGDNAMSSKDGDTLYVDRTVWNKGGGPQSGGPLYPDARLFEFSFGEYAYYEYQDHSDEFPTYKGMPDDPCIDPTPDTVWVVEQGDTTGFFVKNPLRFINFFNGGLDIVCIDTLDDRGDINLNGVTNEIADAVMFSNYFIYGLGIFHINEDAQVAATDVNADGMVLTVGDLVYQIRIIIGDAQPYPKLAPVEASYVVDQGVVSVDKQMGAALVVVEGNVTPTLLADNMDIKYAYNAEENVTRVLVYSFEGNGFSGEFLNANGNVVSIELGSYEGAVVKTTEIPANFALNQNYPNPFNPMTTISFNLPVASEYTLTVYNVTGQVVTQFAGEAEAGVVSLEWDASTNASGIYFYKLNAGDFSATKKMVLLK